MLLSWGDHSIDKWYQDVEEAVFLVTPHPTSPMLQEALYDWYSSYTVLWFSVHRRNSSVLDPPGFSSFLEWQWLGVYHSAGTCAIYHFVLIFLHIQGTHPKEGLVLWTNESHLELSPIQRSIVVSVAILFHYRYCRLDREYCLCWSHSLDCSKQKYSLLHWSSIDWISLSHSFVLFLLYMVVLSTSVDWLYDSFHTHWLVYHTPML